MNMLSDVTVPDGAVETSMIVFTICSRNFFGYAQALWHSLKQHHPNVLFHVGLCDGTEGFDLLTHPFEIIQISDLGIERWDEMVTRYDITELNTALKPFIFLLLFNRYPGQPIFYLDPDILVFSPLDEILAALDDGADCVLTPHVNGPSEYAEMNDQQFLRYGVYNLGFCVLRALPEIRRVVAWWSRRLETQCVIDLDNGLFVDQKWADLFPAYIERTVILRHPGYNIAYWNLTQRLVRQDKSGGWWVNEKPLRFFHFSGNKIENEKEFSRHSQVFTIDTIGDVRKILMTYRAAVHRNGHSFYQGIPYAFNWGHDGRKNVHTPANVEAERRASASRTPFLPVEPVPSFALARQHHISSAVAAERAEIDRQIRVRVQDGAKIEGFCAICDAPMHFHAPRAAAGQDDVGRDIDLLCDHCHAPSQTRATARILGQTNVLPMVSYILADDPALAACSWLGRTAVIRELRPGMAPSELVVLCGERTGDAFDEILAQAFASLEAGGHLLLSVRKSAMQMMQEADLERSLLLAGYSDCRCFLYWSEQLGHFGSLQMIVTARKPDQGDVTARY